MFKLKAHGIDGRVADWISNWLDEVHGASPAAAGQQRKGGTGLVRGPNPAALQITLLTMSTGTQQSEHTVYVQ